MKLTKKEKYWILYDVGNSAFVLLIATIIPIYFNALAKDAGIAKSTYFAYWGYAASITTVIVAILGPILGTIVDTKGYKKPIFTASMMLGVIGCAALAIPQNWIIFLAIFVIAKTGFSASLIFYDAMLTDITSEDRLDNVSSQGYAWGYIGSCIPFTISLVLIMFNDKIGISTTVAMVIGLFLTAGWWLLCTMPLLKVYEQVHYVEKPKHPIKDAFGRLVITIKEIKKHKKIFVFLLAFFFYIDGVYTIIDMATAYGSALGFGETGLLLALLLSQIVACPCSLWFGHLSKTIPTQKLLKICIGCYVLITFYAVQLSKPWEFWVLACAVGMFQGSIQALSRSYYAKIIPEEKSGEFFGIYDICGKGASFLGTTLVGVVTQLTGHLNIGVGAISIMFVIGYLIFKKLENIE